MCWYQQRPERMQTDLNSFNLWEEKYENKAVVIALNNYIHFFFPFWVCDKIVIITTYYGPRCVPTNMLILNYQQAQKIGVVFSVLQLKKLRVLRWRRSNSVSRASLPWRWASSRCTAEVTEKTAQADGRFQESDATIPSPESQAAED